MKPDKMIYTINLTKEKIDSEVIYKKLREIEKKYTDSYQLPNHNKKSLETK